MEAGGRKMGQTAFPQGLNAVTQYFLHTCLCTHWREATKAHESVSSRNIISVILSFKMGETLTDVVHAGKRCGTMSKTRLLLCSEKGDFVGV